MNIMMKKRVGTREWREVREYGREAVRQSKKMMNKILSLKENQMRSLAGMRKGQKVR